jgi:hypothetical protein
MTVRKASLCRAFSLGIMLVMLGVGVLTALQISIPTPRYDERRTLAALPSPTWPDIGSGRFFRELDAFVKDRLFGRGWLLFAYEHLVSRWRKDLIYGHDGWQFVRFITQCYTGMHPTNEVELEAALRRLAAVTKRQGKLLVLEQYRNKDFIYPDKLPLIWRRHIPAEPGGIVYHRVAARLAAESLALLVDHTEALRALRQRGGDPFTPWGETHASPEAMFEANRELIGSIARTLGRTIDLPRDFPHRRHERIDPARGWPGSFHVEALYQPVAGVHVDVYSREGALLQQSDLKDFVSASRPGPIGIYSYDNPLGDRAPLPRAFILSDSFFNKGAEHLSPTIFPYFRSVIYYYNDVRIDGWDEAEVIILSHSDQSTRGLSGVANWLAYRAELRETTGTQKR